LVCISYDGTMNGQGRKDMLVGIDAAMLLIIVQKICLWRLLQGEPPPVTTNPRAPLPHTILRGSHPTLSSSRDFSLAVASSSSRSPASLQIPWAPDSWLATAASPPLAPPSRPRRRPRYRSRLRQPRSVLTKEARTTYARGLLRKALPPPPAQAHRLSCTAPASGALAARPRRRATATPGPPSKSGEHKLNPSNPNPEIRNPATPNPRNP
jgi:hypothetical protein